MALSVILELNVRAVSVCATGQVGRLHLFRGRQTTTISCMNNKSADLLISLPPTMCDHLGDYDPDLAARAFATCDPPEAQLGSGGGTAHVLNQAWLFPNECSKKGCSKNVQSPTSSCNCFAISLSISRSLSGRVGLPGCVLSV